MNDFTKEELQDIFDCLYYENKESEEKPYDKLLDKVQSMIDNFCDHKTARFIGDVYGYECVDCKCDLHFSEVDDHDATLWV